MAARDECEHQCVRRGPAGQTDEDQRANGDDPGALALKKVVSSGRSDERRHVSDGCMQPRYATPATPWDRCIGAPIADCATVRVALSRRDLD